MDDMRRYAIFAVPEGALYHAGAAWLGWDSAAGQPLDQPRIDGLPRPADEITKTPRRYGFHGTLKPPFRLADGHSPADLQGALRALAATLAPVLLPRLVLGRMGGFVALLPDAPNAGLSTLAAATVAGLDRFRAPPTEAELARRRARGLTDRQEAHLHRWGYPYVMEDFRFHMTLTGGLGRDAAHVLDRLTPHFAPVLREPVVIDSLYLMGEGDDGLFRLLARAPLGATAKASSST